jgi:glycosyltransferase involved in cell wall biosynthesis
VECVAILLSEAWLRTRATILRILHVVHRMHPPCFGGLSVYADRICQLHSERGHQVEVWTTLEDDSPRTEILHEYLVRRFPALFSVFENPMTISLVPQLLRYPANNFDLIVVHSHLMFTSTFGSLKSRLPKSPMVLISHGYSVRRGPVFNTMQQLYLSTLARAIALGSGGIVTMTAQEKRRFMNLGVAREKCTVVPSGVDSNVFRPRKQERDCKLITWTGRFVPEKNLTCLIRAFALLKQRAKRLRMILAGDGPERARLMALVRKLRLNDDVLFPGILSRHEVADLLQKSTVFALPSTTEALPLSLLESMSTGVPVIVSRGLGLEDIVNGAGLFADPNIPEEWALRITRLLDDEDLRRRVGRRGRELALTRYDWHKVADRLEGLFLSIVESGDS